MGRRYLIDPNEWDAVASDIGTGVYYWARALSEEEGEALAALRIKDGPDGYTVAFMAINPDTGDDDQLVLMRRVDYEHTMGILESVVPGTMASRYVQSAWANRDKRTGFIETTYLDAEAHDVVAQVHVFGKTVYG